MDLKHREITVRLRYPVKGEVRSARFLLHDQPILRENGTARLDEDGRLMPGDGHEILHQAAVYGAAGTPPSSADAPRAGAGDLPDDAGAPLAGVITGGKLIGDPLRSVRLDFAVSAPPEAERLFPGPAGGYGGAVRLTRLDLDGRPFYPDRESQHRFGAPLIQYRALSPERPASKEEGWQWMGILHMTVPPDIREITRAEGVLGYYRVRRWIDATWPNPEASSGKSQNIGGYRITLLDAKRSADAMEGDWLEFNLRVSGGELDAEALRRGTFEVFTRLNARMRPWLRAADGRELRPAPSLSPAWNMKKDPKADAVLWIGKLPCPRGPVEFHVAVAEKVETVERPFRIEPFRLADLPSTSGD